jgi:hypothetical protein
MSGATRDMNDWRTMALDSSIAAKDLLRSRRYRSAASGAYDATYALVTHRVATQGMASFGRFQNPSHAEVAALVLGNVAGLDEQRRRTVSRAVRVLRMHREDADYRPHARVGARSSRECARWMDLAFKALAERRERDA